MTRIVIALAVCLVVACTTSVAPASPAPPPKTPTWDTFGQLSHPRAYAIAVALASGEILVVGGLDRDTPDVTDPGSELVNVETGAVTVLQHQLVGRLHQTMTRASDRVVVAGGVVFQTTHWDPVGSVDVYLPLERKWISASPLIDPRSDHAATALDNGMVMVTGGNQGPRILQSTEIYDVKNDRWFRSSPLPSPRTEHSSFTLRDGRVLVAGGVDSTGAATDTTFIYNPPADQWSEGPRMTLPRVQHAAVPLANGDILFIGGDGAASGSSERFVAELGRFVHAGTLVAPRLAARAAALPDGRVVLVGGMPPRNAEFAPLSSAEIWDPESERWSALPPSPTARAWPSILVVGGVLYQLSGTGDA
ncbi:MAG TPA: kelch repeat-containing protein, partial [Candidatus Limnocylindria bacterium]|nr:kelch repeat-containing protein [Candidatus Limnocylindria bacterium]